MKSKQKGNAYERKIAQEMRDLGYKDCKTSRYESQMLDDMKVDLTHTGIFHIQCKAMERGAKPHQTLKDMPNQKDKINVMFHKRNHQGEIAVLKKEDFYKIIKMLKKHKQHK